MILKRVIRKIVPQSLYYIAKGFKFSFSLFPWSAYWFYRDLRYSDLSQTREAQLSGLLINGHVLEKGITMPQRRQEFGQPLAHYLVSRIKDCAALTGYDQVEIQAALQDLRQYLQVTANASGGGLHQDLVDEIQGLLVNLKDADAENCYTLHSDDYFSYTSFEELATGRHSLRNFSHEPVDQNDVVDAIRIAQTAPSACNRQSVRVKIIASEEKKAFVRQLQNGNRGFGHLADKFLLITAEQGAWDYKHHTSAFLDAGIFIMNLLYALHDKHIAACTLNAHFNIHKMRQIHSALQIPDSEIPVAFIAIGNAPAEFMVAKSQRLNTKDIITTI